jgi:hypothetical protein
VVGNSSWKFVSHTGTWGGYYCINTRDSKSLSHEVKRFLRNLRKKSKNRRNLLRGKVEMGLDSKKGDIKMHHVPTIENSMKMIFMFIFLKRKRHIRKHRKMTEIQQTTTVTVWQDKIKAFAFGIINTTKQAMESTRKHTGPTRSVVDLHGP